LPISGSVRKKLTCPTKQYLADKYASLTLPTGEPGPLPVIPLTNKTEIFIQYNYEILALLKILTFHSKYRWGSETQWKTGKHHQKGF